MSPHADSKLMASRPSTSSGSISVVPLGRQARPKSTPAHGGRSVSFVEQVNQRPKTAHFINPGCDRVTQVEREATRRHNFKPHIRIQKTKPSPWQAQLEFERLTAGENNRVVTEGEQRPIYTAPGYMLSRSKSKYQVVLNDKLFELEKNEWKRAQSARNQLDPEIESLIGKLREQVADLSLHLEEERIQHRETKRKADEYLKDQISMLKTDYKSEMTQLRMEHDTLDQHQIAQHQIQVESVKDKYDDMIAKLKTELEFLQGAFESYKSQTVAENHQLWNQRENEMNKEHSAHLDDQLKHQKIKLMNEHNSDKAALEREHNKSLTHIKKESKKELETLNRRFATHTTDLRKLAEAEARIEEDKQIITDLKSNGEACEKELSYLRRDHAELKARFSAFEVNFERKVEEVDKQYRGQLNDVMEQNAELRRLYMKKCEEVFKIQSEFESRRKQQLLSNKEAMKKVIESRNRAYVSVAATHEIIEPSVSKTRPSSAPSTQQEENNAFKSIGQTDAYLARKEVPFVRPQSVLEMSQVFGAAELDNVTEAELRAVMAGQY